MNPYFNLSFLCKWRIRLKMIMGLLFVLLHVFPARSMDIRLRAKNPAKNWQTFRDHVVHKAEYRIPADELRKLCAAQSEADRNRAHALARGRPVAHGALPEQDLLMAADEPISITIPVLPIFRSSGRAPPQIDHKVIDDIAARLIPDIQRQMQEEHDRTADQLRQTEKQVAADAPHARGFSITQGLFKKKDKAMQTGPTNHSFDHMDQGQGLNSISTMKALFAFSRPTETSMDLGKKAHFFEKVTAGLKDKFSLDKDQVVGLTAVDFEGTQLDQFVTAPPQTLDITVEVGGRAVNIQATGNSDPSFSMANLHQGLRLFRNRNSRATGNDSTESIDHEQDIVSDSSISILNHYGIPVMRTSRQKRQIQQCTDRVFRDPSGRCNNLNNPTWGQSFQPYVRFLPPDYADGVSVPRIRAARTRSALPSPRQVTTTMHQQLNRPHDHVTHILMQWGQFLDHDITHTPITAIEVQQNGGRSQLMTPKCCDLPTGTVAHSSCFAIPIPRNDPFFPRFGQECLEFVRSSPATNVLGPREQLNQLTSYIDASQVYGSTQATANSLRTFNMGMLLIQQSRGTGETLLPQDTATEECFKRSTERTCFRAGDVRVNVHTGLAAMHTLWIREHNRIARGLFSMNQVSGWDDERVYQETRRILGSMFQHITFNEFLPVVLGRDIMNQFGLNLLTSGYYTGYSDQVNPSVANEFATAAYRFGHSLVNGEFRLDNQNGQAVLANNLVNSFFQPLILYDNGRCDQYLRGMTSQNAQTFDRHVAEELSNHLFQPPGQPFGNDLISRNIQRGRDHGLPGYNSWRKFCGFPVASNFDELRGVMAEDALQRLQTLYESPDDVDLFTAGLSELAVAGGLIGPTFACIIARQFHNLRRGDRYWHENNLSAGAFTPGHVVYFVPSADRTRRASLLKLILNVVCSKIFGPLSSTTVHSLDFAIVNAAAPDTLKQRATEPSEHPQLAEIRKVSLARVLCDNTDSFAMQRRVMVEPIPFMNINPKLPCSQIPGIDLSVWRAPGGVPLMQNDFAGQVNQQPAGTPIQQQFIQIPQNQNVQQAFVFPNQQGQQAQFVQQSVAPQFPQSFIGGQFSPAAQRQIVPFDVFNNQFRFRTDPGASTGSETNMAGSELNRTSFVFRPNTDNTEALMGSPSTNNVKRLKPASDSIRLSEKNPKFAGNSTTNTIS